MILQGGIYEQFVSCCRTNAQNTNYLLVGDNAWFKNFANGCHTATAQKTPKVPINVTGGDYTNFYLTGIYQPGSVEDAANAECYIDGGRFAEVAGSGMQQVKGNVTWLINAADISKFYGGGINAAKPITGSISTTISNSYVDEFYGGPKFGDMAENKTVTTNATDCHFGKYFGAGYGGTAFNRDGPVDDSKPQDTRNWNSWVTTHYKRAYNAEKGGISTNYDYEFILHSDGNQTVARFFVDYASLSLASTHNVTNTLSGCTIGTFYGGGSLGAVYGDVNSTLTDCTVTGNAFGAGFSASVPTVEVWNTSAYLTPNPTYNRSANVFNNASVKTPKDNGQYVEYTWSNDHGSNESPFTDDGDKHYIYTGVSLEHLGTVTGDATLIINGTTSVGGSVFGGGEESDVKGNTNVTMTDGYVFNGIFGGGYAGSVGTFTTSTDVTDYGHVANHEGCIGKPVSCAANTGKCTVLVTGGQIGPNEVATLGMNRSHAAGGPVPEGWVWGGGCGLVVGPSDDPDVHFKTYVGSTDVTIGGTAFILESIIGGGEFGRVLGDTKVTIQDHCQIGVGAGKVQDGKPVRYTDGYDYGNGATANQFVNPLTTTITSDNALTECSHFPYGRDTNDDGKPDEFLPYDPYYDKSRYASYVASHTDLGPASTAAPTDGKTWIGCVFGGGSGYMPYEEADGSGYDWCRSAGLVEGNSNVFITGGHILMNVYGGNEYTEVKGKATVKMSGGTVGVPRILNDILDHPMCGFIFGAGKGDERAHFYDYNNVGSVEVEVSGGIIYGSVFGGSEDGNVLGDVLVNIKPNEDGNPDPVIGTLGTSNFDGNVFGGGRGFSGGRLTAGNIGGDVTMNITGGTILGSVYGGGRLGSVGTYLVDAADANYGNLVADDEDTHGHVTINISGGTIGNNIEYRYNPDASYKAAYMSKTLFDGTNRLLHTRGGNVFAGGMGRREKLDGVTEIDGLDWHKLGKVKTTKVTISGTAWIKSNVYGGGELGAVQGSRTTAGGGTAGTEIIINGGTIGTVIGDDINPATATSATTGTGDNRYSFGSVYGGGYGTEADVASPYITDVGVLAALVSSNTSVSMTGGAVRASLYGGGEVACVSGSTDVDVSGGTIGINEVRANAYQSYGLGYVLFGSWKMGNVYGGGRGSENAVIAGLVKGNTDISITGSPGIYHNIYGGGAIGSVGTFELADATYNAAHPDVPVGAPINWTGGTGTATISITGTPTIGINGHDNGMVCGSSRGDVSKPVGSPAIDPYDRLAWVKNTSVTIGVADDESAGPAIKGSVYGGGENGHNSGNAVINVYSGTIGNPDSHDSWITCGNVFGAGCGTDTYTGDDDNEHYNRTAGFVLGTTDVNIYGGEVLRSVYGAGSMGSAGDKSTVNISGGVIEGSVYGGPKGDPDDAETVAHAKETELNIQTGADIRGKAFGGGESGVVEQDVVVNVTGGTVAQDLYGGGALADTNISNATDYGEVGETIPATDTYTTTVNLHGGTIGGIAFGGGLGRKPKAAVPAVGEEGEVGYVPAQPAVTGVEAKVYGDVLVELNKNNGEESRPNTDNCKVLKIHGANNYNGSPKGDVTVHVYKTVDFDGDGDDYGKAGTRDNTIYDMVAVYGGGNEAAYVPAASDTKANVIIEGCDLTSINFVYGGGNAAPVSGSHVLVNSCYEIGSVFGGGNGFDAMDDGTPNPGANVGYLTDMTSYGSGVALAELYGGTIHYAFGGSNTKGNVRTSATVQLDESASSCPLVIEEVYGAGNKAEQDGTSNIILGCISYLKELYGGSREADINSDIVLTVQSGRFDRVFGGNNLGGTITGTITVNVEETGCHPIIIGQLYGGGNQAAYTAPWKDDEDHSKGRENGPTLNIKSFTSIGEVYGGGYGASATVTGDTYVNINECVGENASFEISETAANTNKTIDIEGESVFLYGHTSGAIGVIGNVFGGGNAAAVEGNTNVTIGNLSTLNYVSVADNDETPLVDESERTVTGVDIRGNVFGGGNNANVTGNTNVKIGKNTLP